MPGRKNNRKQPEPISDVQVTRRAHDANCCTRTFHPRCRDNTATLENLASVLHKDSLAEDYCAFLAELQQLLGVKWRDKFKIFPRVVCWVDAAQKAKYEEYYDPSLVSNETTAENWAREALGNHDFSIALMYTWTISPVGLSVEEFGKVDWHSWALVRCRALDKHGKRILVWDPKFGHEICGQREGSLLGFHRRFVNVAKRGSTTAEVWLNNKVGQENAEGRCVALTLEWLQSLARDGLKLDHFQRVGSK
ncbi:hypothetical protein C8F04DRAFT_1192341 [Mycena alexandri]|uniref:Uncharacterized protein n=1 Tax=Mycena alexandri TaxID=1745969 RepID=A0AAD6SC53_9AGAR|nr:hypothetical protein C8F04DRAFT_1192341 [Mycena alexandri]